MPAPHLTNIVRKAPLAAWRVLVWGLVVAATLAPSFYAHWLQGPGARPSDITAENRAAIVFGTAGTQGRLSVHGDAEHRTIELTMPRAQWNDLTVADRTALDRRLASAVIRGIPVERYVIDDEAGVVLTMTP